MKHQILIFTLWIFFCLPGSAQDPEALSVNKKEVILYHPDSTVKFDVLVTRTDKDFKPDNRVYYYWYTPDKMHRNRGGYAGNLLDGEFKVFNSQKLLVTEGHFDRGLRVGIWKRWSRNGELIQLCHWSEGRKHGKCIQYGDHMKVVRKMNYRKGQLHGRCKWKREDKRITSFYFQGKRIYTAVDNLDKGRSTSYFGSKEKHKERIASRKKRKQERMERKKKSEQEKAKQKEDANMESNDS